MTRLVVTAAVIEEDGAFLVTRRPAGVHLEGHWEFPGGKCEAGESLEDSLRRELREELAVDADVGEEVFTVTHAYDDRTVELHFFRCRLRGAPAPQLGQAMRWIARDDLDRLDFPPADTELIERLRRGVGASLPAGNRRAEVPVDIGVVLKRFEQPDEIRQLKKGKFEIVHLGGMTIGRATYQPGWRWSVDVGPDLGLERCPVEHVGLVISGTATAAFADGRVIELNAGSLFYIPPEPHDSWVVGNEPYVSLHFMGAEKYAARK